MVTDAPDDVPDWITKPADATKLRYTRPHDASLVVIYGDDLGRRIPIGQGEIIIGRSSKCDVQIDQESVSRNHARIRSDGKSYKIRDLGSTNGTYVNDELVDERELRDGDQVKVGRTLFKFLSGTNVEASYHEEIYRLMTVDGLTEVHNRRYFNDVLERELSRCRRYQRTFSVVLLDIDHFRRFNDTYGHHVGDAALRQLAAVVLSKTRRDDVVARIGGEELAVILPEMPHATALAFAGALRGAIERADLRFEETLFHLTVSLGVAELLPSDGDDPQAIVHRAEQCVTRAKCLGRNQVVGAVPKDDLTQTMRPILDGAAVVARAIHAGGSRVVLAFAWAPGTPSGAGAMGSLRRSLADLLRAVESDVGASAQDLLLGTVREHCAVASVPDDRSAALRAAVQDELGPDVVSCLLDGRELAAAGTADAALQEILARLERRSAVPDPLGLLRLPSPIAAPMAVASAHPTVFLRAKAYADALESTLRFFVALLLGTARQDSDATRREHVLELLHPFVGRAVPMGHWARLALGVAPLARSSDPDFVRETAASLVRGNRPTKLSKRIADAVATRNDLVHLPTGTDESYQPLEVSLRKTVEATVHAMAPLARCEMVSMAAMQPTDEDGVFAYKLHVHRGPSVELSPVEARSIRGVLRSGWCYGLAENDSIVGLEPVYFARTCEVCKRLELFVSDDLVLGPRDTEIGGHGAMSGHGASQKLSWNQSAEELWKLLASMQARQTMTGALGAGGGRGNAT